MPYDPYFEGDLSQYSANLGVTGFLDSSTEEVRLDPVYLSIPNLLTSQAFFSNTFEISLPEGFDNSKHLTKCEVLSGSFFIDYATIGGVFIKNNVNFSSFMLAYSVVEFDTEVSTYLDSLSNPTKARVDATFYNDPDIYVQSGHVNLKLKFYWINKL